MNKDEILKKLREGGILTAEEKSAIGFKLINSNREIKQRSFVIKEINEAAATITGIFSTGDEDRHGEIVDQKSWKLDEFLANPVILLQHDPDRLPIGKCIALGFNSDSNLEGTIQFAVNEHPEAATVFALYKGQYMRAFSVGFMNDVIEFDQNNETITLKQNTLYEISCVVIPANAMALAKQKGIDTAPLEKYKEAEITTPEPEAQPEDLETAADELKNILALLQKEGRVLSDKNRKAVENAIAALQEILAAADGKSADTDDQKLKVETPKSQGGKKEKQRPTKAQLKGLISQAVRRLLEEKAKIK